MDTLEKRIAELEERVEELEGDKKPGPLDEFKKLADEFNKKNPQPPYIPVPYPVYPYYPVYPPYYPGQHYPWPITYRIYTTGFVGDNPQGFAHRRREGGK